MRIFLTGGTGYVGRAIVAECVRQGHDVVCLVRQGRQLPPAWSAHMHDARTQKTNGTPQITPLLGDVLRADTYADALEHCDAIIHLVGIIREQPTQGITFARMHEQGTKALVDASVHAHWARDRKRFVLMSALGARDGATSQYFQTKWNAEQYVKQSVMNHVIFRPSVIFGPNDQFVNSLAGLLRLPLTPVIGDGQYRLQPVALETVARMFCKAVHTGADDVTWELGGPDALTYNEMLHTIAAAMHRRARLLHLPLGVMRPLISLMENMPAFPITTTQLTMLLEENICRHPSDVYSVYDESPIPFTTGIRTYIKPHTK